MRPVSRLQRGALLAGLSALLAACSDSASPSPSRTATATPTPTATLATATPDLLSGCPDPRGFSGLTPLAHIPGDDDDLLVTAAGTVWVSQPATRRLIELDSSGRVLRTFDDADGPEGMVQAPDGRLFLAEQRTNHIDVLDPLTGTRTMFATVPGRTGLDVGIDGLGIDSGRSRLLIPDSPEGSLLALPLAGGPATLLASGLGRPVSSAALPDGSVLVAEENPPGLVRVSADKKVVAVTAPGAVRSVDEVLGGGGAVYVTDLAAGSVDAVDPSSGRVHVLVSGSPAPQGLALRGDGRLLLSDSVREEVVLAAACG